MSFHYTDHAQDCRAILLCTLQLARHCIILYLQQKCYVLHIQASSRSSGWPPVPGILLEPRAHVQYGDFDKMVLMQACCPHTALLSDLSVCLPVCLSVCVCFWGTGWLPSFCLPSFLLLHLICRSQLCFHACASAQLINCMPACLLLEFLHYFLRPTHAQLYS